MASDYAIRLGRASFDARSPVVRTNNRGQTVEKVLLFAFGAQLPANGSATSGGTSESRPNANKRSRSPRISASASPNARRRPAEEISPQSSRLEVGATGKVNQKADFSTVRARRQVGIQGDTAAGRQQFEQRMEERRLEETDPEALKALRRGWCLGSRGFRREMLPRMEGGLGEHHSGELHRASAEAKAERILAGEPQGHGWQERDLLSRRKNDPGKLKVAARLRRETTLSVKAIAPRVHLEISKAANAKLHGRPARAAVPAA